MKIPKFAQEVALALTKVFMGNFYSFFKMNQRLFERLNYGNLFVNLALIKLKR